MALFRTRGSATDGSAPAGSLTDSQIGDKAFKNPPGTLTAQQKIAIRVLLETGEWSFGDGAPGAGTEGDWYIRTGNTNPGIYYRGRSAWALVFAAGGAGALTDEQIGDKAFSHPPADLTAAERRAVLAALGLDEFPSRPIAARNVDAAANTEVRVADGVGENSANALYVIKVVSGGVTAYATVTGAELYASTYSGDPGPVDIVNGIRVYGKGSTSLYVRKGTAGDATAVVDAWKFADRGALRDAVAEVLDAEEIGDKAFRNPPSDLTPAERGAVWDALGGRPLFERIFHQTIEDISDDAAAGAAIPSQAADVYYVVSAAYRGAAGSEAIAGNELAALTGQGSNYKTIVGDLAAYFRQGRMRFFDTEDDSRSEDGTVTIWLVLSVSAITPLVGRIPVDLSRLNRGGASIGQVLKYGAQGWGPGADESGSGGTPAARTPVLVEAALVDASQTADMPTGWTDFFGNFNTSPAINTGGFVVTAKAVRLPLAGYYVIDASLLLERIASPSEDLRQSGADVRNTIKSRFRRKRGSSTTTLPGEATVYHRGSTEALEATLPLALFIEASAGDEISLQLSCTKGSLRYKSNGTESFITAVYIGPPAAAPTAAGDFYFGVSDDAVPVAAELTVASDTGVGTLEAYDGEKHMLIARLASEADITSVKFSDDTSQTNQIGVFTKYGSTVRKNNKDYEVWVSNNLLAQPNAVTITAS